MSQILGSCKSGSVKQHPRQCKAFFLVKPNETQFTWTFVTKPDSNMSIMIGMFKVSLSKCMVSIENHVKSSDMAISNEWLAVLCGFVTSSLPRVTGSRRGTG